MKLSAYGFRGKLLEWMKTFLTGQKQQVRVNGSYSGWNEVLYGIPQGSILGPLLFTIYINDLPSINSCARWATEWQLPFNMSKCKILHLGLLNPMFSYTMDSNLLEEVSEEKDLGVIINKDFKFHSSYTVSCQQGK